MNYVKRVVAQEEGELDLDEFWHVVWRYKYAIVGAALLGAVIAAVIALRSQQIFRAETVVTEVHETGLGGVASLANEFGGLASLAGVNLGGSGGVGPQARGVLQSRWLVEEFIRRNGLSGVILPKSKKPPTIWMAAEKFRNSVLMIREDKLKSLTTVSVEWTDPAVAARWSNGLVALANELLRTRALNDSTRNIAYLNDQINKTNVVELRRVMYNLVESETKTLMLANARAEYAFSVVDPAVPPEERSSPKRTLMVLIGFAFGLVLGTFGAYVRGKVSRRGPDVSNHS